MGAAILSGLGLLLALLGLLGTISYSVSARKKEFGIRVALGATRQELLRMVLRETLSVVVVGISMGLLIGIATILLRSQFYGLSTVELPVLVPVTVGMIFVSLLVAYLSAR